jgi:hypothetical protein
LRTDWSSPARKNGTAARAYWGENAPGLSNATPSWWPFKPIFAIVEEIGIFHLGDLAAYIRHGRQATARCRDLRSNEKALLLSGRSVGDAEAGAVRSEFRGRLRSPTRGGRSSQLVCTYCARGCIASAKRSNRTLFEGAFFVKLRTLGQPYHMTGSGNCRGFARSPSELFSARTKRCLSLSFVSRRVITQDLQNG